MIVGNPLPSARASMAPARVCSPADERDSLRGEGIAIAKHAFVNAETYRVDVACDGMRMTLDLHKAKGRIVV